MLSSIVISRSRKLTKKMRRSRDTSDQVGTYRDGKLVSSRLKSLCTAMTVNSNLSWQKHLRIQSQKKLEEMKLRKLSTEIGKQTI